MSIQTKKVPEGYKLIQEGKASIIFGEQNEVFYNKVQVLNRDTSIAVLSLFSDIRKKEIEEKLAKKKQTTCTKNLSNDTPDENKAPDEKKTSDETETSDETSKSFQGIQILEALSATGLRSIRYFQEIPNVHSILVNDIGEEAVEAIRRNIEFNNLKTTNLIPNLGDAAMVMYTHRNTNKFDVIDLDPYGSAAPFLDSALQAVANGGMICVTCTDMAVLSGNHPEVCFARYGSFPNKKNYLHEMALRIVLASIEAHANRYQRHIVPILSLGIDFYVRLFVRVYKSPSEVKKSATKMSHVFQCLRCDSFHLQPVAKFNGRTYQAPVVADIPSTCDQCGGKFKIAGPIWNAPIHDQTWVQELLNRVETSKDGDIPTKTRLHGLLTSVSEEVVDSPLFYTLPGLSKTLHCSGPPMNQIKGALVNAGYQVSQFHKVPDAIKTNAPNDVVWDIMRCWVKKYPLSNKRQENENSIGHAILSKPPQFEADFTVPSSVRFKKKATRFPFNPEANWGPKARARGKPSDSSLTSTSEKKIKVDHSPRIE